MFTFNLCETKGTAKNSTEATKTEKQWNKWILTEKSESFGRKDIQRAIFKHFVIKMVGQGSKHDFSAISCLSLNKLLPMLNWVIGGFRLPSYPRIVLPTD